MVSKEPCTIYRFMHKNGQAFQYCNVYVSYNESNQTLVFFRKKSKYDSLTDIIITLRDVDLQTAETTNSIDDQKHADIRSTWFLSINDLIEAVKKLNQKKLSEYQQNYKVTEAALKTLSSQIATIQEDINHPEISLNLRTVPECEL